jgi:hypothetical protein
LITSFPCAGTSTDPMFTLVQTNAQQINCYNIARKLVVPSTEKKTRGGAPSRAPVAQCEMRADHLGEIEAHALEGVRLQRHCNTIDEDHIVTRHPAAAAIESADQTRRVERGERRRGLTEGLALDLLVGDRAREVEVVHLLLGRLLLMGLRRRGGGSGVGGREGGRGPVGRRRRGRGLAGGGSHGERRRRRVGLIWGWRRRED